ncbi:MAG: ribosome-associated translation inhibitor RaiA [Patescibacteria group bacterium]
MDNLKINAVNIEIDQEIRNYIDKKLASFEKFIDLNGDGVTIDIRVSRMVGEQRTGKIYNTEMSITTPGKKYGANAEGDTLYESLDLVKDAVLRKISGYKDKKIGFLKRGGAQIKSLLKKVTE